MGSCGQAKLWGEREASAERLRSCSCPEGCSCPNLVSLEAAVGDCHGAACKGRDKMRQLQMI